MRDFIESWAKKFDAQVYFGELATNKVIAKVPGQRIYFYGVEDPSLKRYYVLNQDTIAEFHSLVAALDSFFRKIKVGKNMSVPRKLIRKSSKKKLAGIKTASGKKKASELFAYSDDMWIPDPSQLIKKSERDLWSLTRDGKHIARLFDEDKFPLEA